MQTKKSRHYLTLVFLSHLFFYPSAQADSVLPARFSGNAYSSTDYTVGQADVMLSVAGDSRHNFYIDPNVAYGTDNQGYADVGVGYRWMKPNAPILGGYLFGGYTRIDNNARLWVLNPGIEAMGSRWDARLNAYFPMGDRHYDVANQSVTSFSGHSQFINFFNISQFAGNGADIKLGYQLFPQSSLKGYIGSYYFLPSQTNNVFGGAAGLEYWFSRQIKVFANYSYDTLQQSTGAIGLGIELGGTHVHRFNPSLEERMTDPVERYLSELGKGSAIPSRTRYKALGQQILSTNIAFFSQTGGPNNGGNGLTLNNCTQENPCGPTDFSETGIGTLATLLPNTTMYFNQGAYPAVDATGAGPLTLNTSQTIHGRTADYSQPAQGNDRPTFNGAFVLNSNNALSDISLLPTVSTSAGNGILVNTGTNISLTDVQVGNATQPFSVAFNGDGNNNVLINGSQLFGTFNTILAQNGSQMTVNNSTLSLQSTAFNGAIQATNGQVDVNNSIINVNAAGGSSNTVFGVRAFMSTINLVGDQINMSSATGDNLTGLEASNTSTLNVQQTNVNVNSKVGIALSQGANISGDVNAVVTDSSFDVNGSRATGFAFSGTNATLNNTSISAIGNTTIISVMGISAQGAGQVQGQNTNVTSTNTNTNGTSYGLQTAGAGNIQINSGTVNVTGAVIPSTITNGANIQITQGTCILNGTTVVCP